MGFLKIVSKFPQDFFDEADLRGRQTYQEECIYRCPYITSVWDNIEHISYEVPLFWYMNGEDETKPINQFVETIRMSTISGNEIGLDKDEKVFFERQLRVFTVDSYAVGHEINPDFEEFLYHRPPIFIDESGILYTFSSKKLYITLDLKTVITLDLDDIAKIVGKKVLALGSVVPEAVSSETFMLSIKVCDRNGTEENEVYRFSIDLDFNNLEKSKIKMEMKSD